MSSTRFDYAHAGFKVPAAPADSWRTYDAADPDPGYFQFDWLSSRHPDLYDRFARSTDGLVHELRTIVDLSELVVRDVGSGTGRSAIGLAATAREVIAVDAYESVVRYGEEAVRRAGVTNITYKEARMSRLPLDDSSVDAVTFVWSAFQSVGALREAARILRPSGLLILMGPPTAGTAAGELGAVLFGGGDDPREWFQPGCPSTDSSEPWPSESGVEVVEGVQHHHDFTYTASYESQAELAAILGRIYGPTAAEYINDREQSTLTWRLRISDARIEKPAAATEHA